MNQRIDFPVRPNTTLPGPGILYVAISLEEQLARFRTDLEKNCFGMAPNGATYRLTLIDKNKALAVERTHRGDRTMIVGFSSRSFQDSVMARAWAVLDGRHEYLTGVSLLKRKLLV